jgi:hypothetical protein
MEIEMIGYCNGCNRADRQVKRLSGTADTENPILYCWPCWEQEMEWMTERNRDGRIFAHPIVKWEDAPEFEDPT